MRHNYNFERRKLYLPEYGRHIHEMVDQLMEIEDRDERNRQARIVIAVMGNLQPMLRDTADFTHKLWDHLFIMSDFQLDVDSPYPRPTREELMISPRKMEYSQERIAYKHYGKYVSHIIRKLREEGNNEATAAAIDSSISITCLAPAAYTASKKERCSTAVTEAGTLIATRGLITL